MNRLRLLLGSLALTSLLLLITNFSSSAADKCKTTLECAQQAVDAATQAVAAAKAAQAKVDALEKQLAGYGGGRILGIAQVRDNKLVVASPGIAYDTGTTEITFPNPQKLIFVPLIASSFDLAENAAGITNIHWISSITGLNKFAIHQHALDTGNRVYPARDFTAVIIGFVSP